jgi:hypothetical protein
MIVVRLCGGLGNQMFQYAAGRSLSIIHKTELVLDLSWYKNIPGSNTPRKYELGNYNIQARLATKKEERFFSLYSNRIFKRISWLHWQWNRYQEMSFDFDINFPFLLDNTYLDGYWQSFKYFESIADIIRTEFLLSVPPSSIDQVIIDQIITTESVSVHVRRGDYVTQKAASKMHGACSLEYYGAAIQEVEKRITHPYFYVFSDDSNWAKMNLSFPGPTVFVDHNSDATAFQDLRLMSQCRHHVIANSSFSWWGAWLNPKKDKLVIGPNKWFMDNRSTSSLTPNEWIRL